MIERLHELYDQYGVCRDKTWNYFFEGPYGKMVMSDVMEYFRRELSAGCIIGGRTVAARTDYMEETGLPRSNVLAYRLEGGTQMIIRPSGTEAKIKVYVFEAENSARLQREIEEIMERFKETM